MALSVNKSVTGTEPISLDQAKAWLKVDSTADDPLITALIIQARELIEGYLNLTIIETTIVCTATARAELKLPFGPVTSITSVKNDNGDDLEYVWNGFYITFGTGTISVTGGSNIYEDSVTTYDAGNSTIADGLQLGLLETIAFLYEMRGDTSKIGMFLYQNQNLQPYRELVWI